MAPIKSELTTILNELGFHESIESAIPLTTGFSGAQLFRMVAAGHSWCLRGWPEYVERTRIEWIEGQIQKARALDCEFLPVPFGNGQPVFSGNQQWTLHSWLPGYASLNSAPSNEKLGNAVRAINRLHRAWETKQPIRSQSPLAVQRLRLLHGASRRILTLPPLDDSVNKKIPFSEFVTRALSNIPILVAHGSKLTVQEYELQPIVGDLWHDHLLFEDHELVGIIDFDAMKVDSIWCDWGRMASSLRWSQAIPWQRTCEMISTVRPFPVEAQRLTRWLADSGLLLATINWLEWLFVEKKSFGNPDLANARFQFVIEQFLHFEHIIRV